MLVDLAAGHVETLRQAAAYMPAVLAETGQAAPAVGSLNLPAFAAAWPDGGTYDDLLDAPLVAAKVAIADGAPWQAALRAQDALLTTLTLTALADSRREVYQADMAARPMLAGYVRQLNVPSCARCVILAGKWFRWNQGFQRHPRCDCIHIPASEQVAGDYRTDPYEYFRSLSQKEQDRVFGANNAKMIREYGGDIYRVVNVQMRGVGRVSKQISKWGTPRKRVPIDKIIERGGTREQIIAILKEQGYITGAQRAGGNLIGNAYERFSTPISRPIVVGSKRDRVLKARASGVRDPLDRDLMTAAERRLFDANYRLEYARRTGYLPPSITNPRGLRGSDADRFSSFRGLPATPERIAGLERALAAEIDAIGLRVAAGIRSDGMLRVAEAVGLSARVDAAIARRVQLSADASAARGASGASSGSGGGPARGGRAGAAGSGSGGRPPNVPRAHPGLGEPPDENDREAWKAYWKARQDALPIDFQGDTIAWQEVEFYEAFLASRRSITYIPPRGKPHMSDFIWHDLDDIQIEVKTPLVDEPSFKSIARMIRKDAPGKQNFLIDFRGREVPPELLEQLAGYNAHEDNAKSQIRRLFVFIDGEVTELRLK